MSKDTLPKHLKIPIPRIGLKAALRSKACLLGAAAFLSGATLAPYDAFALGIPNNPNVTCTWNWHYWVAPGANPDRGDDDFNPTTFFFDYADTNLGTGQWYDGLSAQNAQDLNVSDDTSVANVNESTNVATPEAFYGVGYYKMTPGPNSFSVSDAGRFEGHAFAVFDSSGNQIARFPDLSDGLYYASHSSSNNPANDGGVELAPDWSDTFNFTVPADGKIYLHYIVTDEGSRSHVGAIDIGPTNACVYTPQLTATKTAGATGTLNVDGTFTQEFTVTLTNSGDLTIENPTLTDDLETLFGAAFDPSTAAADNSSGVTVVPNVTYTPAGVAVATPPAANAAFDGDASGGLISGGSLAPGDSITVTFTVALKATELTGTQTNEVIAGGTLPSGAAIAFVDNDTGAGNGTNDGTSGVDFTPPALVSDIPPNPTDNCTWNWYGWDTAAEILETSERYLPQKFALQKIDTSLGTDAWYTSFLAHEFSDLDLGDNVEPTESTANDIAERLYGIGFFAMEPNTTQTVTVTDTDRFEGHVFAVFDSSGNQITRLPSMTDVAAGNFYYASRNGSGSWDEAIRVNDNWSDSFSFTVPADGQVYIHYIITDEHNRVRLATSNACQEPELTVAKSAGATGALNADGTFTQEFSVTLTNSGDLTIENPTLTDDLETLFGAAFDPSTAAADNSSGVTVVPNVTYTPAGAAVATPPAANAAFDGDASDGLISGGSLAPGDAITVTFTVALKATELTGAQTNEVIAGGTLPSGAAIAFVDNDTGAGNGTNDGSSGVDFTPPAMAPELTSAKVMGTPVLNQDGSFNVPVTITVENTGNVDIDNLQISDDLSDAGNFGSAFVSIATAPAISVTDDGTATTAAAPSANVASFDGSGQPLILSGTDGVIGVGDVLTVTFTAVIDPNAAGAPASLGNTAATSGTDPSGAPSTDDTGGAAGGPGAATPFNPPAMAPELTSAKVMGTPVLNQDGSFNVPVTITVENTGDVDIDNLQISDDLSDAGNFGSAFVSIATAPAISVTDDGTATTAAAPSANAASFDGSGQPLILSGTDGVIGVGDVLTVTFTAVIDPNAAGAPASLGNTAATSGTDPSGTPSTDDTGGAAGGPGAATPFNPPAMAPELTSAKVMGTPVLNQDGSFNVPVTITVENTGNVDIDNLQISDDLSDAGNFGSAFVSIATAPAISVTDDGTATTAAAPSANAASFDGSGQPLILSGTDGVIGVGDVLTVTFTAVIDPNAAGAPASLGNTAATSGTDPSGAPSTDDTGGAAGGPGAATPFNPPAMAPELTSAKVMGTPVLNQDGSFNVPVTITVENTGDVDIDNLQISDDLSDAGNFGSAFVSIATAPAISVTDDGTATTAAAPSANAASFDGSGQPLILSGTDGVIGVGDVLTVTFTAVIDPNAAGAPASLGNTAATSGTDPSGAPSTDDTGGAAGGPGAATPFNPPAMAPELTSAKVMGTPVLNQDGSFNVPVTITVENTGNVDIDNLQISDDLSDAGNFGSAFVSIATAPAISVTDDGTATTAAAPSANVASFDGSGQPLILSGTDGVIGVGDVLTVTFTAVIDPNAAGAPASLGNTAATSGTDPSGAPSTDDTGGAAGGPGAATPFNPPAMAPELTSAKVMGTPVLNQDGSFNVPVTITVENTGDVDIDNLQISDDLSDAGNFGSAFVSIATAPAISVTDDGTATTAAAPSANAASFDGSGQPLILSGTDGVIGVGDVLTVTFTAVIDPNAAGAPASLGNTAATSGTDPSGTPSTDDTGGAAGGPGAATPFNPPAMAPELTSAKVMGTPVLNQDGSFNVPVTITVENTGNVDIDNLQISDDLSDAGNFGSAFVSIATAPAISVTDDGTATTAAAPSANAASFDGSGQPLILSGTDGVIGVGDVLTVTFTAVIDPNAAGAPASLGNTAATSGTDPSGAPSTDDTGGAAGGPGAATPFNPPAMAPELTSAKVMGTPVLNQDGSFNVPVTITVENTGNVDIDNLQISDDLSDAGNFGSAFVSIATAPAISVTDDGTATTAAAPSANAASFDGSGQPLILSGTDGVIGVGDVLTVTFTAVIDPNAAGAPASLGNTAATSGTDPSGAPSTDDTGGAAGGPGAATPFNPPAMAPELTSAKVMGTPVLNQDGSFNVPVTITVENTGNVDIDNLQISDDLSDAGNFGSAFVSIATAPAISVTDDGTATTAAAPSANAASFDGSGQPLILSGTDGVIGVGDVLTVTFTAVIDPNAAGAPASLGNTATTSGTDPSGTPSTDGTGGAAGGPGAATPFNPPAMAPELTSAKVMGTPVLNQDGSFNVPVTITVENTGNVDIDNLQISDDLSDAGNFGSAFVSIATAPAISVTDDGTATTAAAPSANAASFDGSGQPLILSGTDGVIGVGDVLTVTFTAVVDPNAAGAPASLGNTATTSGTDPSGAPSTDGTGGAPGGPGAPTAPLTPPTMNPLMALVKQSVVNDGNDGSVDAGDTITYTYTVTNTGNVDIDDIAVLESSAGFSGTGPLPVPTYVSGGADLDGEGDALDLAVGGTSIIFEAVYTLTQADVDAGGLGNQATVSGSDPSGAAITDVSDESGTGADDNDSTTTALTSAPSLSLDKPAPTNADEDGSGSISYNDTLTYVITATNTGNITQTNVVVSDAMLTPASQVCASVAPGETCVLTGTTNVSVAQAQAGGVDNTASVASDQVTDPVSAGNTSTVANDRDLTVMKSDPVNADEDGSGTVSLGDTLTYTVTATNTGLGIETNVTVSDAILTPASLTCAQLVPGQSCELTGTYVVAQADVDAGQIVNSASAVTDGLTAPTGDSVTTPITQTPQMEVEKVVSSMTQLFSTVSEVTFSVAMVNTGNVTLTGVQLEDDIASAMAPAAIMGTPVVAVSGFDADNSANAAYDGATVTDVLSGNGEIPVGGTGVVDITVTLDFTAGYPTAGNTAYGSASEVNGPVQSDNPMITPGDPTDTSETPVSFVDADGDGAPDGLESSTADRDGDGIPDNADYDPTGYFYCEEDGSILSGGSISVINLATGGVQSGLGTSNNITVHHDGSDGYYQFTVNAAGTYRLVPTYPTIGAVSTDHTAIPGALDLTTLLPDNPYILGAGEIGATGQMSDSSAAANPFYFDFDIEAGDPNVFNNNLPMKFCGTPELTASKQIVGEPEVQPTGYQRLVYAIGAENTGDSRVENVSLSDDLATAFAAAVDYQVVSTTIDAAPAGFTAGANAAFDGDTDMELLTSGGYLDAGESVTVLMTVDLLIELPGTYANDVSASGTRPGSAIGFGSSPVAASDDSATIDMLPAPTEPLVLTKAAGRSSVKIGEAISYTITAHNPGVVQRASVDIIDTLPVGFVYVPGSAVWNGAALEPTIAGRNLTWSGLTIPAETTVELTLVTRVGAGTSGIDSFVNSVSAQAPNPLNGGAIESIAEAATATVSYEPDPVFDCGEIIGKVFDDKNRNGYQDEGEEGLAGVRMATVRGLNVISDAYGRYHVTCAQIPDADRGSNFLLKLDARTLPSGYRITTENPRVVRLTRGKITKLNFGASVSRVIALNLTQAAFVEGSDQMIPDSYEALDDLVEALNDEPSVLRLTYYHDGTDTKELIRSRLSTVATGVQDRWNDRAGRYRLEVELRIMRPKQ